VSWQEAVLNFWFGLPPERHWRVDEALDRQIAERFERLWDCERSRGESARFLVSPDTALAAVILFDQFPRNMFRGTARQFATDGLARSIAEAALDRGFDTALPADRRLFLYMPFEHSEDLADQDRSVALFEVLGDPFYIGFARKHRDVIARFGRFPHRNAMLGRENTQEEQAFGLEPAW
jgi:uncharacterized protein (DUF924 family)